MISLHHDGLPGDVIAGGFVLDLKKGYSATIPMVDPAVMRSSRLSGAHVRFGQPDKREGFPEGTRFLAPLLLANTGEKPVNVDVSVDYSVQGPKQDERGNNDKQKPAGEPPDKVNTVAVRRLTVRPGDVERIELSRELAGIVPPGGIKEAGVDIAYDAPPGTVIGQLTNVDESGDYSFEVPLKDPSAMDMMMEGGYPWTLENGKNTTVYIKNTTDKPVRAYAVIAFPDGSYYNPRLNELQPYQTLAIDLRKLRDSKKPDVMGKAFPAEATHGQFVWRQQTPYSVIGRAETASVKDGIASSFTCGTGCCEESLQRYTFNPDSYTSTVGTFLPAQGPVQGDDRHDLCGGYIMHYPFDIPYWTSSDTGVVYNNGSGTAVFVGAGQTTINESWVPMRYYLDEEICRNENIDATPREAQVTVRVPHHVKVLIDQQGYPAACESTGIRVRQTQVQLVDVNGGSITTNLSVEEEYTNYSGNSCGNGDPVPSTCEPTESGGKFLDTMAVSNNLCGSGISQASGCGFSHTSTWSMCSNNLSNAVWTSPRVTHSNSVTMNSNSTTFNSGTELY